MNPEQPRRCRNTPPVAPVQGASAAVCGPGMPIIQPRCNGRSNPPLHPQFREVPIAQILDHPAIYTAAALAQVTLLPVRPAGLLTEAGLREMLYRVPVHTAPLKDQYVCIGGRGTLGLARRMLEPTATIPVVVRPAFGDTQLPQSVFIDEVILPIFFRMDREDLRRVIWTVLSVKSNEVGRQLIRGVSKAALALIARVSVSWLRRWRQR